MPHLTLTDNNIINQPSLPFLVKDNLQSQIHAYEDLQTVSGKTLKELCTKESSLLVFPDCLNTNNDRIEELTILDLVGSPKYSQDNKIENVDNVKIKTGNLMGFIGFSGKQNHGTQVEIRSRFTENVEKNKQDNFLHYMLEKVFNINLFNLNYTHSKNDGFDFIYLIFPHLLKKALKQGLLRKYQTYKKNDSNVKGVIDINRHIKYNTPFNGKVAYNSREYSSDNYITQLIRHTIEFIKQKNLGKNILSCDKETILAVKQITEATQETYSIHSREKIIHKNLKTENHPYYYDYQPLQKLCMMILSHCKMQYSQSNSPVYGILFDGAWLWEEYLTTILCDTKLVNKKFEHPENRNGKGGIHLFKNRRVLRYPDFYRKNDSIVLDAKYKALSSISKNDDDPFLEIKINFNRDDIHQLVTYMYILKAEKGCFIFPDKYRNEYSDDTIRTLSTWLELEGYGKKINGFGLVIPSVNDYKLFKDKMLEIENKLLENI